MTNTISLVAACDNNGLIGANGKLPWDHIPADMSRFRRLTVGKVILMGRRTHESIGYALPDRWNVVLSRQPFYNPIECDVVPSFNHALALTKHQSEVVVIGGESIFNQAFKLNLPLIVYLTIVDMEATGDTWFPNRDRYQYRIVRDEKIPKGPKNKYNLRFLKMVYKPGVRHPTWF